MQEFRITAGARKHFVSRSRVAAALGNAVLIAVDGDLELYRGTDAAGVEIELGMVPDDRSPGTMACIHAMPTHYRTKE